MEDEGFQYEIWKDEDKTLALHYDAIPRASASTPDRVTRVLDANGDLVLVYQTVRVGTHPRKVLEDCAVLFGDGTTPPP